MTIALGEFRRQAPRPGHYTEISPHLIRLHWASAVDNGNPDITSFRVYSGSTALQQTFVAELPRTANEFSDAVPSGTTRSYTVFAMTALGEGRKERITATTPSLVSVTISPSGVALAPGESVTPDLMATYSDGTVERANGTATWSTSAPGVATVDPQGTIAACGDGGARISALFESVTVSTAVTVRQRTTLDAGPATYIPGARLFTATAILHDSQGRGVRQRWVDFLVNGTVMCSSQTTVQGVARCRVRLPVGSTGPTTYTARFVGDTTYFGSSTTGTVT
jgi:hypothetical protein